MTVIWPGLLMMIIPGGFPLVSPPGCPTAATVSAGMPPIIDDRRRHRDGLGEQDHRARHDPRARLRAADDRAGQEIHSREHGRAAGRHLRLAGDHGHLTAVDAHDHRARGQERGGHG